MDFEKIPKMTHTGTDRYQIVEFRTKLRNVFDQLARRYNNVKGGLKIPFQ